MDINELIREIVKEIRQSEESAASNRDSHEMEAADYDDGQIAAYEQVLAMIQIRQRSPEIEAYLREKQEREEAAYAEQEQRAEEIRNRRIHPAAALAGSGKTLAIRGVAE